MPTERMTPYSSQGSVRYKRTSGPDNVSLGISSALVDGGRTFVKRHKPQDAFIKPTNYSTDIRHYTNYALKATVIGNPNGWYSIEGNVPVFAGILNGCLSTGGNPGMFPDFSSNLLNGVITDLRLKVKDQRVNLAQAYAERKMTANLLADSLTRIAKSVTALRRGNWRAAGKFLKQNWKEAPATWLEYQYGWKPLMQDVVGSCETLAQLKSPVDWLQTVKAGRQEKESVTEHFDNAVLRCPQSCDVYGETFRGIFARVDYAPTDFFLQRLQVASGITNPMQLAWELLPYSFVIDWGVQVGDWISSLDATNHLEFYAGCYTDRRDVTIKLIPDSSAHYGDTPSYTSWELTSTPPSGRRFILSRQAWGAWPMAKAPRFKDPMSLTHVANALSLLAVALKPGPVRVR